MVYFIDIVVVYYATHNNYDLQYIEHNHKYLVERLGPRYWKKNASELENQVTTKLSEAMIIDKFYDTVSFDWKNANNNTKINEVKDNIIVQFTQVLYL